MAEVNLSHDSNSCFPKVLTTGHSETVAFPWFMYTQTKAENELVQRRHGEKQQRECSFCAVLPFFAACRLRNCRPHTVLSTSARPDKLYQGQVI